jgi:hypothetical protein
VTVTSATIRNILAFGEGAADDGSLDGYVPPDPDHFGFSAQVFIGDEGDCLSDSFDVTVCTASWLADQVKAGDWDRFRNGSLRVMPESVIAGAALWLMRRWNRQEFETAVEAVCADASPGPDWGSVASRVGRRIPWEFDHRYDEHVNEHFGEPYPANR